MGMRWITPEAARRLGPTRKRYALISLAIVAVASAALLLLAVYERYLSVYRLDALASEADLVKSFGLVMHTVDPVDPRVRYAIRKWTGTVPLYFDPSVPQWHRDRVAEQLPLLARLTGLEFTRVPAFDKTGALNFVLAPDAEAKAAAARRFLPPGRTLRSTDDVICYAVSDEGLDGATRSAIAVFGIREPSTLSHTCVIEELLHALGPLGDRATYAPSIFSDFTVPVAIPLNDRILLRTLYDPAIRPGMSDEETAKVVPGIIHRLVVGVKARGESALYQR